MKPLKLAPTISTPELSYYSLDSDVAKRIKERETANIVEGYVLTRLSSNEDIYNFYAEINVDNDKLWALFKSLVIQMPDEVALIYQHIDNSPKYGMYVDKFALINFLDRLEVELCQDGFLEYGVISHRENSLDEIFVKKTKYLQCWGMEVERFISVMEQYELDVYDNLNFIDEYPLQTESLERHIPDCIKTFDILKSFEDEFGDEQLL